MNNNNNEVKTTSAETEGSTQLTQKPCAGHDPEAVSGIYHAYSVTHQDS